jgi:osmotically-inducible protein OsmY
MNRSRRNFALMLPLFCAASLAGCAGNRSFGTRFDDQTIETKVKTALLGAPDVSGTSISVEVRSGEVQLSGFVKSRAEAQRAIELARRVEGVTRVIDKMSIRS